MSTYLDSLVQLCCWARGTLQTNTTGMCKECSQWMGYTGFAPNQGGMHFLGLHCSVSRVLCKTSVPSGPCIFLHFPDLRHSGLRCSARAHTWLGCVFCALRRSEQLSCLATAVAATHHLSPPYFSVLWVYSWRTFSGG